MAGVTAELQPSGRHSDFHRRRLCLSAIAHHTKEARKLSEIMDPMLGAEAADSVW